MLAFKNTEVTKSQLINILKAHKKADEFVQGQYFEDGRGCAVGCSLHNFQALTDDHSAYERLFGIPQVLAQLEDAIFEGLDIKEAKKWPLRFTKAIPVGKNLINVYPKFQIWLLTDDEHGVIRFAQNDEQREIIQKCADLFITWPNIDEASAESAAESAESAESAAWTESAAESAAWAASAAASAAWAAESAAESAARAVASAESAARAAAWAEEKSHYLVMSKKLVELIKAA